MVASMIQWFLDNYEDPANSVPFDSGVGGYQYKSGGPYEADEVLREHYSHVPDHLIDQAAERLNSSCAEWVKKGEY